MPEFIDSAAPAAPTSWLVACLCAEWCGSCREYRAVFQAVAATSPSARFVWVDIEDDGDWLDDIDVVNFPTLLIAHEGQTMFFGPMLPHAEQLMRLLAHVQADPQPQQNPDDAVQRLTLQLLRLNRT